MAINNISSALNAYQTALSRIGEKMPVTKVEQPSVNSFQNMVEDSIAKTIETGKQSEHLAIQGIKGKADIQDVVLAVSNAEMALETVVAVRDTAIKAYQTIINMSI